MTSHGSVGSLFKENLSSESLPETELFILIGRNPIQEPQPPGEPRPEHSHPTQPIRTQTIRKPSFRRKQPPRRKIDLPTALVLPQIALPDQVQPSSLSSPKILGGWNFLKRQNGPLSSPSVPLPRESRTSLTSPKRRLSSTDESDRSRVSTPVRSIRPAQSRSSTWTDNVPTVRSLAQRSPSAEYTRPLSTSLYPLSLSTATDSLTTVSPVSLASPKVVVPLAVVSKDNPRGGKFGLFVRRGSVSPGQERTGFFAGFAESSTNKKERSKTEKQQKKGLGKGNESKKDLGLIKQLSNTSSSSYSSSSVNNRKRSFFSTQPVVTNTTEHTRTPKTTIQWGPTAEEGRHTALTTASPPPPPSVFTDAPVSSPSQLQIPLSRTISPLSNPPLSVSPLPIASLPASYSSVSIRSDSASSFSDEEFPPRSPKSQRSQVYSIANGSASTTPTPSEQEDQHRFSAHRMPIASVFRERSSSPLRNELLGRSPRSRDLNIAAETPVEAPVNIQTGRLKQAPTAPERTGSTSPSKHPWWKPGTGRNSPSLRTDLPAPVSIRMDGQASDSVDNTVGIRRGTANGSTSGRRRSIFGSPGSFFSLGGGSNAGSVGESIKGRARRASDAPLTLNRRESDMFSQAAPPATSTTTAKTVTQRGFEVTSRESYRPPNAQPADNNGNIHVLSVVNDAASSIAVDTATCTDADTTTITDADADTLPTPPDSTVSTCPPRRLPSPVARPTEVITIPAGPSRPSNLTASRFTPNGPGLTSIMIHSSKAAKTWVPLSKRAPRPPLTPPLSTADQARYPLDGEPARPQQEGSEEFSPASSSGSEAGDENGAHGWIGVPELGRPVR
ncbi:hypothetical protein [Phaffia rhodozyma]|uniref:Uncharacterized protein n=1 Tax=Phaffia rhodozyma TaxID=264483 RepID=A0A0F7SL62_PHARH|nr:hypothetical protein [Phaffia rhodozyma]